MSSRNLVLFLFTLFQIAIVSSTTTATTTTTTTTTAPLDTPIQIISFHNETFQFVEESLDVLLTLTEPFSILGVSGPGKSGKSFLMNALSEHTSNGFVVGPGLDPQTHGLWLMDSGLVASDGSRLLLLDSQGLFEVTSTEDGNAKLFAMSALLSSLLLYNDQKSVSYRSLITLQGLVRRVEFFRDNTDTKSDVHNIVLRDTSLPALTLAVQGFTQRADRSCTEHLNEFRIKNPNLWDDIDRVFTSITCATLVPPHVDEPAIQDLSLMSLDSLGTSYLRDLDLLRKHVMESTTTKTLGGKPMEGPQLVTLLRLLVHVIDRFPSAPSEAQSFIANTIAETRNHLVRVALRELDGLFSTPPLTSHDFASRAATIANHTRHTLATSLVGITIPQDTLDEFDRTFSLEVMNATHTHSQVITSYYVATLESIWASQAAELTAASLPILSSSIEDSIASFRAGLLLQGPQLLAAYADSVGIATALREQDKAITALQSDLHTSNENSIQALLQTADNVTLVECCAVVDAFDSSVKFPQEVSGMFENLLSRSLSTFNTSVSAHGAWLIDITQTAQHREATLNMCKAKFHEYTERNQNNITSIFNATLLRASTSLEDALSEITLSVNENKIVTWFNTLKEKLDSEIQWLAAAEGFGTFQTTLKETITSNKNELLKQNKEKLQTSAKEAFSCLTNSLQTTECSFNATCLHNWLHSAFAQQFEQLASACIRTTPATATLAEDSELKSLLMEEWQQHAQIQQYSIGISHRITGMLVAAVLACVATGLTAYSR